MVISYRAGTAVPALLALSIVGAVAVPMAHVPKAQAQATNGVSIRTGTTTLAPRGPVYRALLRARVKVMAIGDTKRVSASFRFPVTGGKVGRSSELEHNRLAGIALTRGKRTLRITGLRAHLVGGGSRISGRIDGGPARTLFTLPARRLRVDRAQTLGTATYSLRLTAATARKIAKDLKVRGLRAGTLFSATSVVTLTSATDGVPGVRGVQIPSVPTPTVTTPTVAQLAIASKCSVIYGITATQRRVLDWGLRESFRNYIADGGRVTVSGGASQGGSGYLFGVASVGSYDMAGALTADFSGFTYYEKYGSGDAAALRLWLCNPRIDAQPGASVGALHAEVFSKSLASGQIIEYPNVRLANIDLTSGSRTFTGGQVRWNGVQAKLTTEGAVAFADFYQPGEQLDPINLTVSVP